MSLLRVEMVNKDEKEYILKIKEKLDNTIGNEISDIQNMDFKTKTAMFDCLLSGVMHFVSSFFLYSIYVKKNTSLDEGKECCRVLLDQIFELFKKESKPLKKALKNIEDKLDDHKK